LQRNSDKFWLVFAAIPPAFLATILIFMDQHITAVIINRKENKLRVKITIKFNHFFIAICLFSRSRNQQAII
jgi:hypothetical protein